MTLAESSRSQVEQTNALTGSILHGIKNVSEQTRLIASSAEEQTLVCEDISKSARRQRLNPTQRGHSSKFWTRNGGQ